MKEIVIRLEDELYEQCKNTKLTEENEGFEFHIINSVANGTPLEEELEKIKAEMIEKCKEYRWDNDDVVSDSLIRIIDNHINELKGESIGEKMEFPDTWEEFEKSYGLTDTKEVYSNGIRFMPSFRVKQWLEHISELKGENK